MDSRPDDVSPELQSFRAYLLVLARAQSNLAGEEASDLVQKTLLQACVQQHQFRGQSAREMAAWLKQILRHQLIDACRQQHRQRRDVSRELPLDACIDSAFGRAEDWAVANSTPSQHLAHEEELVRMAEALEELPEGQREAVILHHLQGATLAEVAVQLQRSEGAVAGLLHRGLRQLRKLLHDD